jgi:hypothetical protein
MSEAAAERAALRSDASERSAAVEAHAEPWCQLRHRRGVHPFFHLAAAQGDVGNVVAVCGLQGTKVHNDGVTQMIRCRRCAEVGDVEYFLRSG